jgi:ribosomal protein S18 acetylase RimI-like enzyme
MHHQQRSMRQPTEATTFEVAGARLECSIVPWDSEIFGFPVGQISDLVLPDSVQAAGLLGQFRGWCEDRNVRLVSCRIDHDKLRESMVLERHGFRFIELVYSPLLGSFDRVSAPLHPIEVRPATQDDLAQIEDIAFAAFTTGRFLLDGRLDPDLSRRRYATWVRGSLGSREQVVLKAELAGSLVGFFIVEYAPDRSVYWHLTAVAPEWQGKGVGLSLWQTMLMRHKSEEASPVRTTISGHNLPALNLYARLGFIIESSQMTFHWLREVEH